MLVDELGKEIAKDLIVESKTIRFDLIGPKLVSNRGDLVCNNAKNICPLVLVPSVSHRHLHESVFASHIGRKIIHDSIEGAVVHVLLKKCLETKAESCEIRSEHSAEI